MQTLDVTFTNLSQLSRAYGSPAVDMAAKVLQKSAQGQIMSGEVLAVAAVVLVAVSIGNFVWAKIDEDNMGVGSILGIVFGSFSFAFAIVASIGAAILLCDIWAWTALSDPSLALAQKIFGSMGG